MRSHRGCVGLRGHARRFPAMLLRIGHKRGDGMSLWVQISGISGVFYKLIDACRGIRDRFSAGPRSARSSVGNQTHESNIRISAKRDCAGTSRRANGDRPHDISRPGKAPIAMHHREQMSSKEKCPFLRVCVFNHSYR